MYRQSITILLLIFSSAATCAADKADPAPESESAQKDVVTVPATAKQGKSAQPSLPLDSFTPSDRISADSTVSFPVDI